MCGSAVFVILSFHSCCCCFGLVVGLHLVLLPKHGDPNKAVLVACDDNELMQLAANHCGLYPPTFYFYFSLDILFYLNMIILCLIILLHIKISKHVS